MNNENEVDDETSEEMRKLPAQEDSECRQGECLDNCSLSGNSDNDLTAKTTSSEQSAFACAQTARISPKASAPSASPTKEHSPTKEQHDEFIDPVQMPTTQTQRAVSCPGAFREGGMEQNYDPETAVDQDGYDFGSLRASSPVLLEAELVQEDSALSCGTVLVTAKEVSGWEPGSREKMALYSSLGVVLAVVATVFILVIWAPNYNNNSNGDHGRDDKAFRDTFKSEADRLLEGIADRLVLTMRAADTFMFGVVSRSRDTNWPYVTLPDLPVQSAKLMSQTKAIYMAFYPLITAEKRADWENFTTYNHQWVEESIQVQSRNPNFHGPILEDYNVSYSLWNNEGPVDPNSPGPFLPSWMGSPVIPYYYPFNWNALSYEAFSKPLLTAMNSKTVIFGPVANHADPNDPVAMSHSKVTNDWAVPFLEEGEDPSEPFFDMYYPVIEKIDDVVSLKNDDTKALGSVAFSFYWRDLMKAILTVDSKDIAIVFHNPCGDQYFTYYIASRVPIFLGYGDFHDRRFEDMAVEFKLAELEKRNDGLLYTGLSSSNHYCIYTLTVYPHGV